MKLELLDIQWLKNHNAIMTVRQTTRSFFGFKKVEIVRWRGVRTVWHNADTGKRAYYQGSAARIEGPLCDLWTKAMWDRGEDA